MRRANLLSVAAAFFTTSNAQVLRSDQPQPPSTQVFGSSNGSFAKVAGRLFDIDGTVGYFSGTNSWWLGHMSNDSDNDVVLKQMVEYNIKVTRVWGFADINTLPTAEAKHPKKIWYQLLNKTGAYINYGADGLQRLDYAIAAAERIGVKIILPFINNWNDLGGIEAYTNAFGGTQMDWYSSKKAQGAYRAYIKVLVERYKASPAIFAWELGNEPRCEGCPIELLTNWTAETARYIKSLDSRHMVTNGEEGFFSIEDNMTDQPNDVAGTSFLRNIQIDAIDFGCVHLYPSWWAKNDSWGNWWIKEHDKIGAQFNKPVLLEEYGTPRRHAVTIEPWLKTVEETNIAGDGLWQFGPLNTSIPTNDLRDDFTVAIGTEAFDILARHAKVMKEKKVNKIIIR